MNVNICSYQFTHLTYTYYTHYTHLQFTHMYVHTHTHCTHLHTLHTSTHTAHIYKHTQTHLHTRTVHTTHTLHTYTPLHTCTHTRRSVICKRRYCPNSPTAGRIASSFPLQRHPSLSRTMPTSTTSWWTEHPSTSECQVSLRGGNLGTSPVPCRCWNELNVLLFLKWEC